MEQSLKETVEEKLFKRKVLQAVIFSQIAVKPIIEKFDNKQELSQRDYKLLNKFQSKMKKLLEEDMPLRFRERGCFAIDKGESGIMYFISGGVSAAIGIIVGSVWGNYQKDQFLHNSGNSEFINNAMQVTNSHTREQLAEYLSINRDRPDLVNIYDHFSEVIQQSDKIASVSGNEFMIAAIAVGVLIPTCIIGFTGATQLVSDFVDTVNYDIRNMCDNAEKINEKILPSKEPEKAQVR